jgi:hypothetical protein
MFVKVPDTSSVNSIVVECENEDESYKVIKFFHMENPIQTAFDYPSSYTQSEALSFVVNPSGYITAHYTSAIGSSEKIFVFSRIGDTYEDYSEDSYSEDTENNYIIAYETIKYFLDQMGDEGEAEGIFTFYVTDYKGGTYRKGVLSFLQAENGETVTLNPDGTADLVWDTNNFSQCNSTLELLQTVTPSTTDNDGEEVITTTANSIIYIYKLCPTSDGGTIYYKRFDIAEPAETTGSGSNGTLSTDTNIPETSTPG